MNRKEKNERKMIIGQYIDLGKGHYTDDEVDRLYDAVKNREVYDGKTINHPPRTSTQWYSGGKYERTEWETETFCSDDTGIRIEKKYESRDDDGERHSGRTVKKQPRDILSFLYRMKK